MIFNREKRQIKITGIHSMDATFHDKEKWIGRTGTFTPDGSGRGYFSGWFYPNDPKGPNDNMYFFGIRYIRI